MADINSLMVYGLSARQAHAVTDATLSADVNALIALGFAPRVAELIVADESSPERFMALGVAPKLAVDIVAVITA